MAKFNYNKSYEDYLKEYYEKEKQRKQYEAQNNPGEYNSKYQSYINDYMGRIANREPFNYDYTTDKKYQAYRDEQMRLGQRAMRDTAAQAAALTGGYGNSYGATAAASMYNQYAQQAANMIPQYEELAYNRWRDEGQDMYNRLAMYQNADATDYGRYRDRVGDFQAMLNYYTGLADTAYDRGNNRYNADYSNAYNMWRAQQADEQDARDYAFKREQYEYQKQQDAAQQAYNYAKLNASNNTAAYEAQIADLMAEIDALKKGGNGGGGTTGSKIPASERKQITTMYQKTIDMGGTVSQKELNDLKNKYIKMGYDEDEVGEMIDNIYQQAKAAGVYKR